VKARNPFTVAQHVERGLAHAGHDSHAHRDVGRIGELHADVRDGRTEWPHGERHDVHGAGAHAASKEIEHVGAHGLGDRAQLLVGAGVVFPLGADGTCGPRRAPTSPGSEWAQNEFGAAVGSAG